MRIGIDIRPLQTDQRFQGVGHYTWGLLQGLSRLNLSWKFVLFFDRTLPLDINLPNSLSKELVGVWRPRWEYRTKEVWNQLLTPIDILRYRVSLLHLTAPEFLPIWLPVPRVVTIHDLFVFGEFSPLKTGLKYRFLYSAAASSDRIIAVSQATKIDLIAKFGSPSGKVEVIYEAVDDRFFNPISHTKIQRVKEMYRLYYPYILYIGDLRSEEHNARKNLPSLLTAFAANSKELEERWLLVLAGKCGDHANHLLAMAKKLGIADQVIFTDYVPENDLPSLMAGATIFAYPSQNEGFGLPILEAMAAGVPVLTSNKGAIPEICCNAALLVNPKDTNAIFLALKTLMTDADFRKKLSERGRDRASCFSWELMARQTFAVYERTLKNVL